jgi:hypothetical protein
MGRKLFVGNLSFQTTSADPVCPAPGGRVEPDGARCAACTDQGGARPDALSATPSRPRADIAPLSNPAMWNRGNFGRGGGRGRR